MFNLYPGSGLGSVASRLLCFGLGSWFRVKVVVGGGAGLYGKEILGLVPVTVEIEVRVKDVLLKRTFIFYKEELKVGVVMKLVSVVCKLRELKDVVINLVRRR